MPYAWIYRSCAYVFVAGGTAMSALALGTVFVSLAYSLVPVAVAVTYDAGAIWIVLENRRQAPTT